MFVADRQLIMCAQCFGARSVALLVCQCCPALHAGCTSSWEYSGLVWPFQGSAFGDFTLCLHPEGSIRQTRSIHSHTCTQAAALFTKSMEVLAHVLKLIEGLTEWASQSSARASRLRELIARAGGSVVHPLSGRCGALFVGEGC